MECDAILEELETVDDEADAYGIDFVKNNDAHAARQYNIYNTPALVSFVTLVTGISSNIINNLMFISRFTSAGCPRSFMTVT